MKDEDYVSPQKACKKYQLNKPLVWGFLKRIIMMIIMIIRGEYNKLLCRRQDMTFDKFTHVSLKHIVVFFFGTQRFFQNHYMALVVLMLFFQGLHLGWQSKNFLISLLNLKTRFFKLAAKRNNMLDTQISFQILFFCYNIYINFYANVNENNIFWKFSHSSFRFGHNYYFMNILFESIEKINLQFNSTLLR